MATSTKSRKRYWINAIIVHRVTAWQWPDRRIQATVSSSKASIKRNRLVFQAYWTLGRFTFIPFFEQTPVLFFTLACALALPILEVLLQS